MKACELDLIRGIRSNIALGDSQERVIDKVTEEVAALTGVATSDVKSQLLQLFAENTHTVGPNTVANLLDFFNGDRNAYLKTKVYVKNLILDHLFNGGSKLTRTDQDLNIALNTLISSQKRIDGNYKDPVTSSLVQYLRIQNDKAFAEKTRSVGAYLVINHLPLVVNSWLSDIFGFNTDTGKYEYAIKHDLRRNWKDDDDREAKMNKLLEELLGITEMQEFDERGRPIPSTSSKINLLNRNAWFYSVSKIKQEMPAEDFEKYLQSPKHIITYLLKRFDGKGSHGSLHENVIHSFLYQWIKGEDGETNFYENSKTNLDEYNGTNPLDMIIQSFNKNITSEYVEYIVDGKVSTITVAIDERSAQYARLMDDVDSTLLNLDDDRFSSVYTRDSNGNLRVDESVTNEQLSDMTFKIFGETVKVDNGSRNTFINALKQIADFKNQNKIKNFSEYLEKTDSSGNKRSQDILLVFNKINSLNPYAVSGSMKDAAGKSLPVINLVNLSGAMETNITRHQIRNRKMKEDYRRANEAGANRVVPIAPYEHSTFFNHKKGDENNLFLGVRYRATITSELSDETVTKDMSSLSEAEMITLQINDVLNPWISSSDEEIRVQAITPSDKSKIPYYAFRSHGVKRTYGTRNADIERKVISEISSVYKQNILNAINSFAQIFNIDLGSPLIANASELDGDTLIKWARKIDAYLEKNRIGETEINIAVNNFNKQYGLNTSIAKVQEYVTGDIIYEEDDGSGLIKEVKKKVAKIAPIQLAAVDHWSSETPLDTFYYDFLKDLGSVTPSVKVGKNNIQVASLLNGKGLAENAKDSILYTYFLIDNILSQNMLINNVGSELTHKNKGKGDYKKMNSQSNIVMVKRMPALTATMHPAMIGVLTGLPDEVNTMTLENAEVEMFAFSGNSTDGKSFRSKFDVWDGAMHSTRITDTLMKQSTTDVKPTGNDLKLLIHSFDTEKGSSHFVKMASHAIDNAVLRLVSNKYNSVVGGYDPEYIMRLQLESAVIDGRSFDEKGRLIDYDGNPLELDDVYTTINGNVYVTSNIRLDNGRLIFDKININNPSDVIKGSSDLNLFSIWKNIFNGAYSTDEEGNYGEQSQDNIVILLNMLGTRASKDDLFDSQENIDQYLKKQIVHYFPTQSAQKSLQAATIELGTAVANVQQRYTKKLHIENLGIQMDPDHSAEDGELSEPTQAMSYFTEGNLVPERTKRIYSTLDKMIQILSSKVFVDTDAIQDPVVRTTTQQKLDRIFGRQMTRIFADPKLDVMGMANEIMKQVEKINKGAMESIQKYNTPYSDHQMLGKFHTSVGSYFNKFISRTWSGRSDILMPSHNLVMMLDGEMYDSDSSDVHFVNDFKYMPDGTKIPMMQYLEGIVWENGKFSTIRESFKVTHTVSPYNINPGDIYYEIDPMTNTVVRNIVIDSWNKMDEIKQGITNRNVSYVKAIDLPRNLRAKRAWIQVGDTKVSIYHFKTMQQIASTGIMIEYVMDSKNGIKGEFEFDGRIYTLDSLRKYKSELQKRFNEIILKAIFDKDLSIVKTELPETLQYIEDFEYKISNDEIVTTNNYTNAFGIKNMSYSEIRQRGPAYFKEKLIDKYQEISIPSDFVMYDSNGKPTGIIINPETINPTLLNQITPVVDPDEGCRIDNHGNLLYTWPENAKLYQYKYGDKGINVEVMVTDQVGLETILKDEPFVFYRGAVNIINAPKSLQNLNNQDVDKLFNARAVAQYESWKRSNEAFGTRIPAQALAFGMVLNTVGYLPWDNNVTMVPNNNMFLEGSDKIYVSAFK